MKTLAIALAGLLLAAAYWFNLGSAYAPTNGDEMVYVRIAQLTLESGHWLPLVSDLQTPSGSEMRNTKPPLLFWQAMAAGNMSWDLFVLRMPYALQTLLCAVLVGFAVLAVRQRAGRQPTVGTLEPLLAAALFLGFFSTYRYGRPVLPSSTESLFLFAACVFALWFKGRPLWLVMGCGVLMIPALLVKSFVLAAPVGLWLFLMWWLIDRQTFWQSGWLSSLAVALGLAGFALWFVLDPGPVAVWREFVLGENFSTKFSESRSDSLWTLVLAPFLNAGLLAPLVVGLCWVAARDLWQRYRQLGVSQTKGSPPERWVLGLWLWIAVWLLVFALPSQRSARYVIPVMPAVALLLALYAPRINRLWWILTLSFVALAGAGMAWIAYALSSVVAYSALYGVALAGLLVLCVVGIVIRQYQTIITAAASVALLALLGALAIPFDGEAGRYPANAIERVVNQTVWVPQNFNAQFQKYSFILPGAKLAPYAAKVGIPRNTTTQADAQFAVQFDASDDSAAARLAGASDRSVKVLASRWVLRGRHAPGEVTFQKLGTVQGVQALLVEQEFLVELK